MFALAAFLSCALAVSASPIFARAPANYTTSSELNITAVDSLFDGQCFYPKADDMFSLSNYTGRWYQVAGTVAPFTAGCTCIYAEYTANENGTVGVTNGCQLGERNVLINGTAEPADQIYGSDGVFRVSFPGSAPPECPGPNYIVQAYEPEWAIVQASNYTTLFLLSREQNPPQANITSWLERAELLGSNMTDVQVVNQTSCMFT